VTISTVGYGDITPSPNSGMRTFTVLYILVGSGYAFGQLANLLDGVLEAFTIRVKRLLKRTSGRDRTAATGDGTVGAEVSGRSVGIGGVALDIDGDGIADFIQPPPAFVFWTQELLPALLLLMRCTRVQKVQASQACRPAHLQAQVMAGQKISRACPSDSQLCSGCVHSRNLQQTRDICPRLCRACAAASSLVTLTYMTNTGLCRPRARPCLPRSCRTSASTRHCTTAS